jgi:hypothetical protein
MLQRPWLEDREDKKDKEDWSLMDREDKDTEDEEDKREFSAYFSSRRRPYIEHARATVPAFSDLFEG